MQKRLQNGTTLIEALIALVVLSIGLLGVAALQMNSVRGSHGSYLRSQATMLAYDIADRMRANRSVALSGSYNLDVAAATPTGTALNQVDLNTWRQALASILPGGTGGVDVDIATGIARITVSWTDRLGTDTFTTRTQI